MNDKLVITVSGYTASGKSRVSYLLKEFLTAVGFEVDLNLADGDVEDVVQNNLMNAISNIASNKSIVINEVNMARPVRSNAQEI